MPRIATKIKAGALALVPFILSVSLLSSCGSGKKGPELPPNPVLGIESRWGAVSAAYVRVKSSPSSGADDIAYLRKAEIVEVVSRGMGRECLEEERGYWFGVTSGTAVGWVYSGYLEVYDSREKAQTASRKMNP